MTESNAAPSRKEIRLERELILNAPAEAVWKALTDPNELTRWFPLKARVTPGKGGKIFVSWGPGYEGEAEILAWEPNKKFASKSPLAVIEWTLESRGAKTVVHLVQNGFSTGADWENEWFESTDYGWGFMLLGLRWSLEVHPGENRTVAWSRQKSELSRSQTYGRLLEPSRLFVEDLSTLRAGDFFALTTPLGGSSEKWTGTVEFIRKDRGFCLSVRELNNALFWLTIEGAPGEIESQIWLSAFSVSESQVQEFESEWKRRLQEILVP